MKKRVLAFRHVPFEGLGHIESVLCDAAVEWEYADLYRADAPLPRVSDASGLIFMGGPMSANDALPYLQWEIEAIREAIGRGQPVLGVCLGAQLMAKAAGARVFRNPVKEIGWFEIQLTEAASSDLLFKGLGTTQSVFQWHGETFDLPPQAVLLATAPACVNQAFRLGAAAYALQFHLEVTPAMIADWCLQDANCGDVRELSEPIDAQRNAGQMEQFARLVFGRWAALL